MATEQDWIAYADQGYLAETDTLLARTAAGAGVEVPALAVISKRVGGVQYQARGRVRFDGYGGASASPTEIYDWTFPVHNIVGFGDYSQQTMLAFTLPNDGDSFTGFSVWNVKLAQVANSITSSGVQGLMFGGPGYLGLLPQSGPVAVCGIPDNAGGAIVGSGAMRTAALGGYCYAAWHSADFTALQFVRGGAQVGTITCSASGTQYNTTSDETLKDDYGLLEPAAAAAIMRLIAIHRFRWKSTCEDDIGAFAQELHKVYPRAVTPGGWIDSDGNPIEGEAPGAFYAPWSVNYNALAPVMAAAWQNVDARLSALERPSV